MPVKIERFDNGATKIDCPDNMDKVEFALSISCIYLHAKAALEELSNEFGVDMVKAAEEKIQQSYSLHLKVNNHSS